MYSPRPPVKKMRLLKEERVRVVCTNRFAHTQIYKYCRYVCKYVCIYRYIDIYKHRERYV